MHATVYGEPASRFDSGVKQNVELLRFTTGYRTGMEVLLDLNPYSPLLDAVSKSSDVQAFAFIDTWVGKSTGFKEEEHLEVSDSAGNGTGSACRLVQEEVEDTLNGNGWALSADLVLWRKPHGAVDTRPRETITLASGPAGGTYDVGTIRYHEGWSIDDGRAVLLDEAVDLGSDPQGSQISVFKCPEGGLAKARQTFLWAKSAAEKASAGPGQLASFLETVRSRLTAEHMAEVNVLHVDKQTNRLVCEYLPELEVEPSMPVYFRDGEVQASFLQSRARNDRVGSVVSVDEDTFSVQLDVNCIPSEATGFKPHLKMPKTPAWKQNVDAVIDALSRSAAQGKGSDDQTTAALLQNSSSASQEAPRERPKFWALEEGDLAPLQLVGTIVPGTTPSARLSLVQAGADSAQSSNSTPEGARGLVAKHGQDRRPAPESFLQSSIGHGTRLCVLDERHTGLVFDRHFDVPMMEEGDRAVLQFVVTGHGWAKTEDHCGEFCHAIYKLNFNGGKRYNVVLWRDDCKDNPWGPNEEGTWDFARNGWCPGSVEPGLFMDVTEALREGRNELQVDMQVQNEQTKKYESYYDRDGYESGDKAMMVIGMTLSVYPKDAVSAIQAQGRAYTAAERALRDGSSVPDELVRNEEAKKEAVAALLQMNEEGPANSQSAAGDHKVHHAKAMQLLKQMALNKGTRTPSGVMVAQPVGQAQPAHLGRTTLLRKTGKAPTSHIQELFAEHSLRMSDEEFRSVVQEAADVQTPRDALRPAAGAGRRSGAGRGQSAAQPGGALVQVQEVDGEDRARADAEELADYSSGCSARVGPRAAEDASRNGSSLGRSPGEVMDFESAAPWYCYSTARDGAVGHESEASAVHRVTLFDRVNVHSGARTVTSAPGALGIPAGFRWGRAALHFRLDHPRWPGRDLKGHPFGEDFDYWDRLGSLGFHLPGNGPQLSLFPADETRQRQWALKAASRGGAAAAAGAGGGGAAAAAAREGRPLSVLRARPVV